MRKILKLPGIYRLPEKFGEHFHFVKFNDDDFYLFFKILMIIIFSCLFQSSQLEFSVGEPSVYNADLKLNRNAHLATSITIQIYVIWRREQKKT